MFKVFNSPYTQDFVEGLYKYCMDSSKKQSNILSFFKLQEK